MFNKHLILDLPAIPKQRKELQSLIHLARHQQRKRNLMMFTTVNLVGWGFYVILIWGPTQHAASAEILQHVYLPLIIR